MKNKTRAVGVIAIAAIIVFSMTALSLTGCNNDTPGGSSTVVDIRAIQGVTIPAAGAAPRTAITPTEQYTGSITWSPAVSGTFAASTVYTATITLAAESGYTLQGVTENFFTVAGTSTPATNAANSGAITAVFPATGTPGNPTLAGSVTIPGFIKVDEQATATPTGFNATALKYQWQKSSSEFGQFNNITSAATNSYKPVAADENQYIRVAVSADGYNGTRYSNVVMVRGETAQQPVINNVTVTPSTVSVSKGGDQNFSADVTGSNLVSTDQNVNWSVNSTNPNTRINDGWLSVAANETAATLTVTATSVTDPTKSGTATVTVTAPAGKVMTITGMSAHNGKSAYIYVMSSFSSPAAYGEAEIANGQLTAVLFNNQTGSGWNGSGDYWISISFGPMDAYLYTNGAAIPDPMTDAPKYNIQSATTEIAIAFNLFKQIPMAVGGRQLTITGLGDWNGGTIEVTIKNGDDYVAYGYGNISGNQVTVTLAKEDDPLTGWTANGPYIIWLDLEAGSEYGEYLYTNGQTFLQLEINSWSEISGKAPKYNFSGSSSSIAFNLFKEWIDPQSVIYNVNVTSGAGGSVEAEPSSGYMGDEITLTISTNNGYRLNTFTVKDAANNDVPVNGNGSTRTFRLPASSVTVNATFVALPANTIAVKFTGFADESINLSQGTSNDLSISQNQSLIAEVIGDYDSCKWYVDGNEAYGWQNSYEAQSWNFVVGIHTLAVVVWKDGAAYSKEVTFRVVH